MRTDAQAWGGAFQPTSCVVFQLPSADMEVKLHVVIAIRRELAEQVAAF